MGSAFGALLPSATEEEKKKENGHIVTISQMQLDPKMRRKGRFYQKVSLSSLPGGLNIFIEYRLSIDISIMLQ